MALLKNRFITADKQPDHWLTLMDQRALIVSRMHELLLDVHIDERNRVAYKTRVTVAEPFGQVSLLRDVRWSAYATALLVVLRQRLRAERTIVSDDVYIGFEDMVAEMTTLMPQLSDESRPTTVTVTALKAVATARLVREVSPGRYLISPALESLLPLPKLDQLLSWLTDTTTTGTADRRDAEEAEAT
ncbi:DUF4194 domain-containing protein [Gordonia terrae]|uniref:DUF4194 domain-containing protein n=1 Tax=Gordonia terrae TaxID=2055 RepID=UPI00187C5741|nr:DUF4194 domain-containing protein [Gordonia terrae]